MLTVDNGSTVLGIIGLQLTLPQQVVLLLLQVLGTILDI